MPISEYYIIQNIMNNDPTAYPDIGLSSKISDLHAQYGRRFNLFIYCFQVHTYDYCGTLKPSHSDPNITSNIKFPFERKMYAMKMKPAWKCSCICIYMGDQFYMKNARLQMN